MPILSVIIPVYNVADFLDDCLRSVIGQKLKDIEIICVNDGSTDASLSILEQWEKTDSRIISISQENKGVSTARNVGLNIAKGDYITFVDADDMVCDNIYETSISVMLANNLDAYIYAFRTFPNGYIETTGFRVNKVLSPHELFSSNKEIQTRNSLCFNWRFIYKRNVIFENNLFFVKDISIGEDMIYNIDAICHSNRIMVTNDALYMHRLDNSNSAMTVKYKKHLEQSLIKMYQIKKRQIKRYDIDCYTTYSFDLACYSIKTYLPMFFSNLRHNPNISSINIKAEIKRILALKMIKESFVDIGFRNIYPSWKEYMFYLAMKFGCTQIVQKVYFK